MNAVEIEEAVSKLAEEPFDGAAFPFRFLEAFGNKEVTIRKLRAGAGRGSDVAGGVLQRNNIHLAVAAEGQVGAVLEALRDSPKTRSVKGAAKGAAQVKFILATDGVLLQAEELASDESLACAFAELPRHFGFFLPLAGISTVQEIKNNPVDVKATGRLNKLYVELLRENPEWGTEARRPALNRFMARLIFCFFAEDTGIFHGSHRFTPTVERMSDAMASNTHEIIGQLFRAMGTRLEERGGDVLRPWSEGFPYVNGGLFTGDGECPRFSRMARAYLLRAGKLDWKEINPDIFGSMIQAVADDAERGALGLHYTSVPNILKVLNPLFLDGLREQLAAAGGSVRKLRALRRRMAALRVFDPACGSGNFLVIAYLQMRAIEAEIVARTGDAPRSWIGLPNFYGIEIKTFAAEIARLALLIAEFQADCRYLSQQEARAMVLPLHRTGQIVVGNALRLDWLSVCPPATKVVVAEHDLGGATGRLALEDNGLEEGVEPETFICGNPPYLGSTWQSEVQKDELRDLFAVRTDGWRSLDYVTGWLIKAVDYGKMTNAASAFVTTNSICQGQQVPILWPLILEAGREIFFAHTSFKWTNLASRNAGVTVIIVGLKANATKTRQLISNDNDGGPMVRTVDYINPYLVPSFSPVIVKRARPLSSLDLMDFGSKPVDGGHLLLEAGEVGKLALESEDRDEFVRRVFGSFEFINGVIRHCIWLDEAQLNRASAYPVLAERFAKVAAMRRESTKAATRQGAAVPYRFDEKRQRGDEAVIIAPSVSSESRSYLPAGYLEPGSIVTNLAFGIYDAPLWNMALIASRIHLVWIATVCGKLKTDFRYSNTLGWNTFPVPPLTEQDKADLTRCAEGILLAREAHFPATIAELYDPAAMPEDLRRAHEANDETLETIYIGRRFRNDTERLETLFELYTQMAAGAAARTRRARS